MPHAIASYRQSAAGAVSYNQAHENVAAALVEVLYPRVLQQEVGGSWMDLELALWRAITEIVNGRCNTIRAGHSRGD